MTTATARTDLIEIARGLRPKIESYAEEAEEIRQLPGPLVQLLRDNGVIGMSTPPPEGPGLDLVSALHVVEEISIADASTGWCSAIGSGSIGRPGIRQDVARQVFRAGSYVCGVGAPQGRLTPVDGGYRLNGRWAYASGCKHADWIFMGSMVFEGDAPRMANGLPDVRVVVAPISDVEILDTWHVSGLRGTGSHDIEARDLFVPEERVAAMALGRPPEPGMIPMFTLFGLALAPVGTGAARRAIDELIAMAQGKAQFMANAKLREKPVVQHEIARAEGMLEAGRAYFYQTVEQLVASAAAGEEIDMAMRARVKLAVTQATTAAADATAIAYRLGGGAANYERSALQRCFRDVNAVTQHFIVAPSNFETVGRVLLGLDSGTPII